MCKLTFLTFLVLFLGSEKIFSQSDVQNIENEINKLSFVKQGLKDSLISIDQKIDSLQSVISSLNFDELTDNQTEIKIKVGSAIYRRPAVTSDRVISAGGDSRAFIVEINGSNYVKVNLDGSEGYAPIWAFEDEDYINSLNAEYINRQPKSEPEPIVRTPKVDYAELERIENQNRRNSFISENPQISETFKRQILNGQISIGMTREMAEASWGKPSDINRTVTSNLVREQWVYGSIRSRRYLYFSNGILNTLQD